MKRAVIANDKEALKIAAKRIVDGDSIKEVLVDAGFSPKQAQKGRAAMPVALVEAIAEHCKQFERIGAALTPERVNSMVKGRLAYNVATGKSDGNEAAKSLGSLKEYGLYQPDSMTGVIVLQVPNLAPAGKPLLVADSRDLLDTSPILDVDDDK